MKSGPAMGDNSELDDLIIQANALIGTILVSDVKKLNKKQTIPSPLGELTYDPDKQFRDGTIRLSTTSAKKGFVDVHIDYITGVIKFIKVYSSGKKSGILGERSDVLTIGDSEVAYLSQAVSALAREVLNLRKELDDLKDRK